LAKSAKFYVPGQSRTKQTSGKVFLKSARGASRGIVQGQEIHRQGHQRFSRWAKKKGQTSPSFRSARLDSNPAAKLKAKYDSANAEDPLEEKGKKRLMVPEAALIYGTKSERLSSRSLDAR